MYTIYYIYNNRIDTMKCALKKLLPYCIKGIKAAGAKIICVKDYRGEVIEC